MCLTLKCHEISQVTMSHFEWSLLVYKNRLFWSQIILFAKVLINSPEVMYLYIKLSRDILLVWARWLHMLLYNPPSLYNGNQCRSLWDSRLDWHMALGIEAPGQWPGPHFTKTIFSGNLMEIGVAITQLLAIRYLCMPWQRGAVSCAKFCSNHIIRIKLSAKRNFHWI